MGTDGRKDEVSLEKRLEELYALIEGIEIAMLTTRRPDGRLVSRPMATQERRPGSDLWFVTDIESDKIDELASDSNVALAYYNVKSWEWVSISATATIVQDRELIRERYQKDWKAWFEDLGGTRDGGPDDPRFALLLIDVKSAVYGKRNKPKPLALFEVAKGIVTGQQPNVADVRSVAEHELKR